MRVFVTGASGHIGSAVVPELLKAGHQVVGLARSDASAAALREAGAQVQRGELGDLDSLRAGASSADGVIHLAFRHDDMASGNMEHAVAVDLAAVRALGAALVGTDKALIGVSGTLSVSGLGRAGTEDDADNPDHRSAVTKTVLEFAERGVRAAYVRIPPVVHSSLDKHGFIPTLIAIAKAKGVSGYVGEGTNHWSAGHTLDVASLFRLAVEKAPAGSRLHAVGDEGIPFRRIAETIGRRLGVPTERIPAERANEHFGFLGPVVALDAPASSALTQQRLGWNPVNPGLLADLDEDHYFTA